MAKPESGMYKTKARNLTDAQLKRVKGLKSSTKRSVSISNTTRATTGENKGFTLGPGGKRLTGTVIMANGDRAVYKGGKRVTNVVKKSVKSNNSNVPRVTPKRTATTVSPSKRGEGSGQTSRTSKGLGRAEAIKLGKEGPKGRLVPGPVKYVGETKYLSKSNMEKILAKNRKNNVRYGK